MNIHSKKNASSLLGFQEKVAVPVDFEAWISQGFNRPQKRGEGLKTAEGQSVMETNKASRVRGERGCKSEGRATQRRQAVVGTAANWSPQACLDRGSLLSSSDWLPCENVHLLILIKVHL